MWIDPARLGSNSLLGRILHVRRKALLESDLTPLETEAFFYLVAFQFLLFRISCKINLMRWICVS